MRVLVTSDGPMTVRKRRYPPNPKVAQRLCAILEYHDLRPADLSRRTGITPASISQWMNGITAVSEKSAHKIADALGEDPDFILCRKDSGAKGLGAAFASLMRVLGPDRIKALQDADAKGFIQAIDSFLITQNKKNP